MDGAGGPGGNNAKFGKSFKDDRFDVDEFLDYPYIAWNWLLEHSFWFSLIIIGIFLAIAIMIVFTWLSSRGSFMFLDNVIHSRAEVVKPWHEFKEQGNSLFVWRLIYGFICFLVICTSLIFSGITLFGIFSNYVPLSTRIFTIIGLVLQFLTLVIIMSYISLFLSNFVVPIMYKNKISTSKAWTIFLSVFQNILAIFIVWAVYFSINNSCSY